VRAGDGPHRATLLGAFRLTGPGGANLTPRARKTRALLAYLLITPGPVSRDRLAALLWGDRGDEQAKASLRQALYELRDLAGGPDSLLVVERDAVSVRPGACELDIERLIALARSGEIGPLSAALERVSLDLLADLYGADPEFDEWLLAEQVHGRARLMAAAVEAGEAALANGRAAEVRRLADALGRADPLSEPAVRLGLRADRAAGDLAALHRRYRRFAERLQRELAAAPAPETQALLEAGSTPEPLLDASASAPSPLPSRRRVWPWLAAALVVVVVALAAAWGWSRYTAPPASPSLAVLPFRTAEPGRPGVYFGSGVSESVRDLLARDPELKVVGVTTARFLGGGAEPLKAARGLGMDYVLSGQAQASGGRTDVTARLVRVRDGRTVWTSRYQRPAEDIFAVQNEIAAAAAQTLGTRIAPRNNPHLVTRPEVYDRYLQARGLARERRGPPLREARRLLLEAAALDPDYAPAFAALSQVTMLLTSHHTSYGDTPIPVGQAEARRYARRALELAPDLGEAYAAYGLISLSDSESLPFYARAVALDPQRPEYHRWLGQSYSTVGREADALAEYQRAAALDPLWWLTIDHVVSQLHFMGRGAEAAEVAARFVRVSNDPFGVAWVSARLALREGRLADYLRQAEAASAKWPGERALASDVAQAWALLGENGRAARELSPDQTIGRLSLAGDTQGLAREARRMGANFWADEPGYWGFAEALVTGGEGALLLRLYDGEFDGVEDFYSRAPSKALQAGPALVAALSEAGRRAEAEALAGRLLRRLDEDVKSGMQPAHAAYDRASLLALTGKPDAALEQLAVAVRQDWMNLVWVPARGLADRVSFRGLRGDPRLVAVQAELDIQINRQRALLGLPPLRN